MDDKELELLKRLVDRLEHLSADSTYAHRASGLRGSLLRYIDTIEAGNYIGADEQTRLDSLVGDGFVVLELAAKEIGKAR